RVGHPQRLRDPLTDELVQRQAARPLHYAPEDVSVVTVDEGLARLPDERERSQAVHFLADRLLVVGGVPAVGFAVPQVMTLVRLRRRCPPCASVDPGW